MFFTNLFKSFNSSFNRFISFLVSCSSNFFVALSFVLFVVFVIWAGLPSTIIKSLDDRSEQIKKELDEARILHEEAQKLLATEKRKLEQCDAEVEDILKQASEQAALITEKSNNLLKEEIQRKQKQADLKIAQARDEAVREVKVKIIITN